jgi:predicted ester cyclase
MGVDDNKEAIKRLIEHDWSAATQGNPDVLHTYFASQYVSHTPLHHDADAKGVEGLKTAAQHTGDSASDLRMRVDLLVAEGDMVVAHWSSKSRRTGRRHYRHVGPVDPHNQEIELSGVVIFRFDEGKIVEGWSYDNHLDTLAEHGLVVAAGREA